MAEVSITLAQLHVDWDVPANLRNVLAVLDEAEPGDLLLFPEGMLSGYDDDLSGLDDLDPFEMGAAPLEC